MKIRISGRKSFGVKRFQLIKTKELYVFNIFGFCLMIYRRGGVNMVFSFNEKQRAALEKLDLPADPDTVFMIIEMQLNYLMTHNKNYTKAQYERIDYINDINNAIYRNFKED